MRLYDFLFCVWILTEVGGLFPPWVVDPCWIPSGLDLLELLVGGILCGIAVNVYPKPCSRLFPEIDLRK